MRLILLVLLAILLPLVWGWLVHWLVKKWWPLRQPHVSSPHNVSSSASHYDYQI